MEHLLFHLWEYVLHGSPLGLALYVGLGFFCAVMAYRKAQAGENGAALAFAAGVVVLVLLWPAAESASNSYCWDMANAGQAPPVCTPLLDE